MRRERPRASAARGEGEPVAFRRHSRKARASSRVSGPDRVSSQRASAPASTPVAQSRPWPQSPTVTRANSAGSRSAAKRRASRASR